MNIEPADQGDISELHALVESAYRGETAKRGWTHEADLLGGQRTDIASLQALFDDPDQVMLAARKEGKIIGSGRYVAIVGMIDGRMLINQRIAHEFKILEGEGLGKI